MRACLEGVRDDEKEEWLNHPCSEALAIFFETIRMKALEGLEAGVQGDMVPKLSGQASLCADIRRFIAEDMARISADHEKNSDD